MSSPKKPDENLKRKRPPATTPDAREKQLIALAVDLAEKQLEKGTASSQVIAHFLKLGSSKERLEQEMMVQQNELLKAKTEAIQSAKNVEKLYKDALNAMKTYSGNKRSDDDEEDDNDD
jgi:regulator of replication initiation timing